MITYISLAGSVVIGVIAAWMAGRLMRGNGFGLAGDIVAGVLGAVIGGYALSSAGMNIGSGVAARFIAAFIGATLVLLVVHGVTGRRDGHRSWS